MFYSLTGEIVAQDASMVAVSCAGIAFKCLTTLNSLQKCGQTGDTVTLYTYLSVSENAVDLYGFADPEELAFFKTLLGVSGVGPKAAVSILSQHTPASLSLCIASGDVKGITRAQGVGPKIAQRIVLELKDKMTKLAPERIASSELRSVAPSSFGGNIPEAISALSALGFSGSEASQALASQDPQLPVEDLIRIGLRGLSKGV